MDPAAVNHLFQRARRDQQLVKRVVLFMFIFLLFVMRYLSGSQSSTTVFAFPYRETINRTQDAERFSDFKPKGRKVTAKMTEVILAFDTCDEKVMLPSQAEFLALAESAQDSAATLVRSTHRFELTHYEVITKLELLTQGLPNQPSTRRVPTGDTFPQEPAEKEADPVEKLFYWAKQAYPVEQLRRVEKQGIRISKQLFRGLWRHLRTLAASDTIDQEPVEQEADRADRVLQWAQEAAGTRVADIEEDVVKGLQNLRALLDQMHMVAVADEPIMRRDLKKAESRHGNPLWTVFTDTDTPLRQAVQRLRTLEMVHETTRSAAVEASDMVRLVEDYWEDAARVKVQTKKLREGVRSGDFRAADAIVKVWEGFVSLRIG
ncbi:hypothetical protein W97_07746 [Coniosporium apollinis CBS 100218]|uniref:Uncharacterized protein n=1 Tax=Coniosporium apollinis (strain CBS 100218) TaxID=1168221 RepID=R7Z2M8_CONA1|nr:uncharacterized protein W97_07746 [Coniosporium apollinis CBS 100218]EON68422.1 hypothetical protein W97_07746 [Coniosporium apollinis CBS 100218]